MADIDTELQTFGFQSTSPLSPGNKLKDRIGDEYQSTDTVSLESPLLEAQLENLDFDTELFDIPECVENPRTPMVDNIEEEVVLDSDDDSMHRTKVVSVMNESCFDKTERRLQGIALNLENKQHTPSLQDKDTVAGSFATDGKQCYIAYTRRRFSSVSAQRLRSSGLAGLNMPYKGSNSGPISIHSDSHSQKQLFAENCGASREYQFSVDGNIKVVVQNHEDTLNESKGSSSSCEATALVKDTPLLAHDHELTKLQFGVSQESGESSQANVLDFVDRYLSMNNVNLSPEVSPKTKKTHRDKSPPVLSAKGPQRLARKANLRTTVGESGIFEWDENQIDGVEVTLIQKKKELILDYQGRGPISAKRPQSAENLNIQKQMNLEVRFKAKLQEEIMGQNHSYSSLMVQNSDDRGVEQRSETEIGKTIMELDEQINAESLGQQLEDHGIEKHVPDMFDVGFDTQMAAEAMEALLYAPPNYNVDYAHQGPEKMCESSPKVATKSKTSKCCSLSKRASFDAEVIARKPKRTKRISKKLGGDTTTSIQTLQNNQKDLSSVEENSCGEELSLGKYRNISTVAHRTSRWSSVTSSEKTESPINSSGERKKDTTESCVLKERRKRGNMNADALQMQSDEVSQLARTDIDMAATDIYLKLDSWSYLRGQRRCRSVPSHSNGASNKCGPLKGTAGKKGIVHCFGSNMLPEGNSKIDFFSVDVKRKARSSVYTRQRLTSSEKKCEESLIKQSFDEPKSANKGGEIRKQACKRTLSKSPFMKELIRLGIAESLPSFASKDLRRRRNMANVRVLFSQNLDDFIIKQQKKILTRLGISIASCCSDATHFITDRFLRTRNMLEAIALGKPVVTHLWLESCGQASCFIDEKNYILRDAKKEKKLGFSMPVSLARARQHPLLNGRRVFITPNVKPCIEMIAGLVKTVQGKVVDRVHGAATNDEMIQIQDDVLILSCEQDYTVCVPFLEKGAAVYTSELLLNGIVTQNIDYERHKLFTNHIKRSCSRKCPSKEGNQALPAVKRS